jgi:hypothetical protein
MRFTSCVTSLVLLYSMLYSIHCYSAGLKIFKNKLELIVVDENGKNLRFFHNDQYISFPSVNKIFQLEYLLKLPTGSYKCDAIYSHATDSDSTPKGSVYFSSSTIYNIENCSK